MTFADSVDWSGIESYRAAIAAHTAASVMLLGGSSASSKNLRPFAEFDRGGQKPSARA